MKEQIQRAIAACRSDLVEFASGLVAIPSENPPGQCYRECAEFAAARLRRLGLAPQMVCMSGSDAPCVIAFHGAGAPTLYFHGHYDVVPAAGEAQRSPSVQGENLFGRGSSDMKGGLAAMVYAVHALRECGIELNGRIGLVFVPDEETGGSRGSRYLSEAGLLGERGVGMLTAEPTGGVIWNACRGAISLRVTVKGKPAHVGLHYQGVNAFEHMMRVAQELLVLKNEIERRATSFRIHPEAARRSILLVGGEARGGTNFNVVPAECSFTLDRRLNPEEDFETEKRRLLELFGRLRSEGIVLDVEILQEGRSAGVPEDAPLAQALAASVAEITGNTPEFALCPGLLEIRYYVQKGVPGLAYGPGLLTVSHGPKEFVPLRNLEQCAAIYALTAARFLRQRSV